MLLYSLSVTGLSGAHRNPSILVERRRRRFVGYPNKKSQWPALPTRPIAHPTQRRLTLGLSSASNAALWRLRADYQYPCVLIPSLVSGVLSISFRQSVNYCYYQVVVTINEQTEIVVYSGIFERLHKITSYYFFYSSFNVFSSPSPLSSPFTLIAFRASWIGSSSGLGARCELKWASHQVKY
jgi:hypothetical protein